MPSVTRCRQLVYACGPTVQADKYGDVYIGITPSVCHPFHMSAQYLLNCSTIFCVCAELGMVVYYHEVICHAQKLVHSLECQGHSEGLNIENVTFSSISSKLLVCLQPNMV